MPRGVTQRGKKGGKSYYLLLREENTDGKRRKRITLDSLAKKEGT